MRGWLFVLALFVGGALEASGARIAIIIDDIGYRPVTDYRALALPTAVAISVLPHSPHGAKLALAAHRQQRPILLHMPMQSLNPKSNDALLGPDALQIDTTRDELQRMLDAAFRSVPHARGLNNHMGSLLTQHPGHMQWLMEALRCRESAWFLDSFTTAESVGLSIARANGIPALRRHIFLDDEQRSDSIRDQFGRLVRKAQRDGAAIAIGHPLPETLAVLEELLPTLEAAGIQLVAPEQLLAVTNLDPGTASD